MKATKTWVLIVLLLIPAINLHAWPIPGTGLWKCYNNTAEISCPEPGQPFYGQDGNYTINSPSYTKLDASGSVLPDTATTWAMVKDNVTGLIWENKTSDGSLHDGGKTFTWCDPNPTTNGGDPGTCGTGTGDAATDMQAYLKALNDTKFGGFSDWRVPTVTELTTIVNHSRINPSVNMAWFPNTVSSGYWSSTAFAYHKQSVWIVRFSDGNSSSGGIKVNPFAARVVRGGQSVPIDHFVINGDGTVTDTATGLMWQQETVRTESWEASLSYAEGLNLGGYDDWRLPNITELLSLVDYSANSYYVNGGAAIDARAFPGTSSGFEYNSSTTGSSSDRKWIVGFAIGTTQSNGDKLGGGVMRAVRSGQSQSLGNLVISAPAQAARWEIGGQKTIIWDTAGVSGNVKISLSRAGGDPGTFSEIIADSVPNSGTYAWTVTGPDSYNCALRIESLADPAKGAAQSLFSIATLQNVWISSEKKGDPGHYKLTLNRQYTDGLWPLTSTWVSSDPATASFSNDLLTALKNGYVEVTTTFLSRTYKKGMFVYATFDTAEMESNNIKTEANVMTEGRFYRGRFSDGTDVDYFRFNLANPSLIDLGYLSYSGTADVKVELFNAADLLMTSGISQNGQPLTFPLGLPAGDYYLKLSSAGDVDQTNYYIVSFKNLGNLPVKTTVPIALGESKSGTLNHLADQMDLTFTLTQVQGVKVNFIPSGDLARYRIVLLNDTQTVIDQVDCLEHKPVTLEASYGAGSYTLRLTPVGDVDALSPFTVQLKGSTNQLETEPNDEYRSATAWNTSQPITGRFATATDIDFYRFDLDTPRYVELAFACPGSGGPFSLTLYKDSDQNEIDGIDIPTGQNTSLHMGLGNERYYLKVRSSSADTVHSYTLTLKDSSQTNLEIESNNTLKVANAIEKGIAKKGRIYSQADKDYYGFHLPTEDLLAVAFTPSTTTGDYKISLRNEDDALLESFTSVNGQPQSLEFYQSPGNYYLKVEPNGDIDQYKTYDLTLTSAAAITGIKQLVSVTVSGSQAEMQPGNTQNLVAKAGYSDASAAVITPLWTPLDPAIATVDSAGSVTAVAEGTTSIVAAFGGLTGKFDLKVGTPPHVVKQHYGNLILVAGGGIAADNTLKDSTQYLSDLIYKRFKARLFADEDIYYMNPLPWHDLDGDGYGDNIVDDTSLTVAKFGQAITTWAVSQDTDGPLYVYLIDHGGIDSFMLYPDQIVTADQLKSYLNTFQTDTGRKVVVIIEACKSGSFTDNLIAAGRDRVVITSTDDQDAYIQLGGRISFSQFLVDRLLTGDSLNSAYLKAKQQLANMGLPYSKMQPKIEGNALSATSIKLGGDFAIASLFPAIAETSPDTAIAANPSSPIPFYARLSSLDGIDAVWAVVVPPDYVPPDPSQNLEAPTVTLPTITLADPEKDKRYEGSYSDFIYNGDYRITFYARNTNGNVSVSPSITVTVTGGQNTPSALTVTKTGTGGGTVTSNPAGINCGTDCSETYSTATTLTLTAVSDNNSDFAGWSGMGISCPGTGSCTVSVDGAKLVNADFTRKILKGDLNNDGAVNLVDTILALRAIGGLNPAGIRNDYASSGTDVNGDNKIGMAEVIYILQKAAGMR